MSGTSLSFSKLPREIWAVTIANMLVAISTTMTFSISPFYMTTVLGISIFSMGALEGFTEGLSQVSKLFSGVSSDYSKKKKPTLMVGFILAALSKPFFILASGLGAIGFSKILERISNGVIATPRDAYVADIATPENRGASFGVMMTGKCIGCIIGPFLVSFLMFFTEDYRMLLWVGFIPCVLAIVILWRYMNEAQSEPKIVTPSIAPVSESQSAKLSWTDITNLPPQYWTLLVTSSLFMLARFSDSLIALQLKALGTPTYICVATIGIFNTISALCCYPIGWLSDRMKRSTVLYFSYITLILCNLCLICASDMWLGLLGVVFWGAQRGSSQILFTAMIADEAPKKIMGTAIGLFYIVIGVMSLIAGAVAGWLADMNLTWAFVFGGVVSTIATLSLTLRNMWMERVLHKEKQVYALRGNSNVDGEDVTYHRVG